MCLFLWTDFFNAPLLPGTPQPQGLLAHTHTAGWDLCGHHLSKELLQRSGLCKSDLAFGCCGLVMQLLNKSWVTPVCQFSQWLHLFQIFQGFPSLSGVLPTQLHLHPHAAGCSFRGNELPAISRGEFFLLFVCWYFIISTYAQLILFLTVLDVPLNL